MASESESYLTSPIGAASRSLQLKSPGLGGVKRVVFGLLLGLMASQAFGITIYVSPNGSDSASGASRDFGSDRGPLKTLPFAQQALRDLRRSDATDGVHRVVLMPGRYVLRAPLVFQPLDGGLSDDESVIWEAERPGSVEVAGDYLAFPNTLNSGLSAVEFPGNLEFDPGGIVVVGSGGFYSPPTEPKGFAYGKLIGRVVSDSDKRDMAKNGFVGSANVDVSGNKAIKSLEFDKGAYISFINSWDESTHEITSINNEVIRFQPPTRYPLFYFSKEVRYKVHYPGRRPKQAREWGYVEDGTGGHSVFANSGRFGQDEVNLPLLKTLIKVKGGVGSPVRNLRFSGLNYSLTSTKWAPFVDRQGAPSLSAAIEIGHTVGAVIERSRFTKLGGYAISIGAQARNTKISENNFDLLGGGAVRVGLDSEEQECENKPKGTLVLNNKMYRIGRIILSTFPVFIGDALDNVVSNNRIDDIPNSAIAIGWTWGYKKNCSRNNRIEANLISNVGDGRMNDYGGIYLLGPMPGTVVSGNEIRSVRTPASGKFAWPIYLDEGAQGILVSGNTADNYPREAIHIHFGRQIKIRGNCFVDSAPQLTISRPQDTGDLDTDFKKECLSRR